MSGKIDHSGVYKTLTWVLGGVSFLSLSFLGLILRFATIEVSTQTEPDHVQVHIENILEMKSEYERDPSLANLVNYGNSIDTAMVTFKALRDSLEDMFFHALAIDAGNRYNVNWRLLYGIWKWESQMDPSALGDGKKDAKGDVIPGTHRAFGLGQVHVPSARDHYDSSITAKRLLNPIENGYASAAILKAYLDRFNGNEHYAIAAYNAGPSRIYPYYEEKTMPPNFWNYNQKVYGYVFRAELTM